ncbi:hypothetical protein BDY21DRAFT_289677 [Lineolata rhizophorae]|uniref:UDENN domain-containing protein n=1 Tax=Lineolata rhizophorae TaxID=578093 RepID=A0A6A6NUG7_9PEZI|nr:hypothetical protein BDY21DRAFT_289677 [Lineolata rhizophorae]
MDKLKHVLHPHRASRQRAVDRFRHWAVAFVVCNFNVDVGPEIELVHPPETPFSQADLSAICFNSFPERQQHDAAPPASSPGPPDPPDLVPFHFTLRNASPDVALASPCPPYGSPSHLHAAALFRQQLDRSTKRSFNQKTLVLVSNHPFTAFFLALLRHLTATGLLADPTALEAAASQMAAWPPPSVGRHELPFLGSLLVLDIPPHPAFPLQGLTTAPASSESSSLSGPASSASAQHAPAPIYAYEPVGHWAGLLRALPGGPADLHPLYEKLLLCEPVVVLSRSPRLCSDAVSCLLDLIRPVPYAGEARPYLTMQSDFFSAPASGNGSGSGPPRHYLVGITNPFLLGRVLSMAGSTPGHPKPFVLHLDDSCGYPNPYPSLSSSRSSGEPGTGHLSLHSEPNKGALAAHPATATAAADAALDLAVLTRRHFAELTAQFLAPLNRYFATRAPPPPPSPSPAFHTAAFLASLAKHGTSVRFRSGAGGAAAAATGARQRARDAVYGAFCQGPNFRAWVDMKVGLEKEAAAGLLGDGGGEKGG